MADSRVQQILNEVGSLSFPGVFDTLSARITERVGFPMAFAIGTDITNMAGNSLISTMRHAKFGNVDYRLGFIMIIGTVSGFEGSSSEARKRDTSSHILGVSVRVPFGQIE